MLSILLLALMFLTFSGSWIGSWVCIVDIHNAALSSGLNHFLFIYYIGLNRFKHAIHA